MLILKSQKALFFCTNTILFEYKLISWEDYKYDNIDDITKFINNIVNKLIVNEFAKSLN